VMGGAQPDDPLAAAVEAAWRSGIVVVAAAGNDGGGAPLTTPAHDPLVLAVGAAETAGTVDRSDDTPAPFSSTGTDRTPDLLAPGTHVVSLRDPSSFVDVHFAATGRLGDRLFLGSGTSQATAVVSGAAALVEQAQPALTPDQVKQLLVTTAAPVPGGAVLDLERALGSPSIAGQLRSEPPADEAGAAASGAVVPWPRDDTVSGLVAAWNEVAPATGAFDGNTWSGNTWSGNTWSTGAWS